jgi:hypothetical protein
LHLPFFKKVNRRFYYKERLKTFFYSGVIKINMTNGDGGIAVYPNPVTGNLVHVLMTGQQKGGYQITIYNNAGARVLVTEMTYDGTNSIKTIVFDKFFVHGTYYFEINGPGKKSKTFKLFID